MPTRLCLTPRCPDKATYRGRCQRHAKQRNRETHQNRSVYNSKRWQMLRRKVLLEEPICQSCDSALSEHADHIVPIEQGGKVWDRTNLQGLCAPCHSTKTRQEQT